mgnify:CR=1 FL=1
MQNPFFNVMASFGAATHDTGGVQFWDAPDRSGWLMKQGDVIKTWRSRFFVLKDGKLFWFSGEDVTSSSTIRGVIDVRQCLSVKGAEDVLNRQFGFELSSTTDTSYVVENSATGNEERDNSAG